MQRQTTAKPGTKKGIFLIPKIYNPEDWENEILDKKEYTSEDYEKLPEGSPYQLIGGKLLMTPAPGIYHQDISRDLGFKLYEFVKKNTLGKVYIAPVDVKFNDSNEFQPDIIFISRERENIIGKNKIEGSPDIVIEILSPSNAYYDLREKYEIYEKHGVREYWIVDPMQKKIEVYENIENKFFLNNEARGSGKVSSKVLQGFKVSLEDVF